MRRAVAESSNIRSMPRPALGVNNALRQTPRLDFVAEPTPLPTLEAEGVIVGQMDLVSPVTWGAIELRPEGDDVHFTMSINIEGNSEDEIDLISGRIGAAVEAAVSANCNAAVKAHVQGLSRPKEPGLRRVTKFQRTSWDVHVLAKADPESVKRASAAAQLVLGGGRAQELQDVNRAQAPHCGGHDHQ